jgi:NADH dehydrogenase
MKDQTTTRPKVVIIGGGFAGVQAAKRLGHAPVDVVLLDRNNFHVFQPLLYQTAMSVLSPSDIARPLRSILSGFKNVEVLMAEATEIDRVQKRVMLADGEALPYDYLIVASGSTSSYFGHNEWAAHAFSLKSIGDALAIRTRLLLSFEQAERDMSQGAPQPALHFVVIGGGPTGVELAGCLADITKHVLRKDFLHVDPSQTKISLYEGSPTILPPFPEELQKKALEQLIALGVEVHTNARITDIQRDFIIVGDQKVPSTLTLWAAGVTPSSLGKSLGCPMDRRGAVIVNLELNPEGEPNIFVCGDLAAVTENGRRIPSVAQPAMQMGAHTAKLIKADLAGKARTPFHYFDKGDMATIGAKAAVARIAWPFQANWSGVLAWLTWLLVHLAFLSAADQQISVLFTWVYSYLTKSARSRLITQPDSSPARQR